MCNETDDLRYRLRAVLPMLNDLSDLALGLLRYGRVVAA
jgi:hypothetical protein